MARKARRAAPPGSRAGSAPPPTRTDRRARPWTLVLALGGVVALAAVAVVVAVVVFAPRGSSTTSGEATVRGQAGQWTSVTPDRLAQLLAAKDFTLVNVKTPYIGEIAGTDLYIPYDQLAARRAELPSSRSAKIVVYCRSGAESAIAVQTLLGLGYTNVWDLAGGMNAWTATGRTLVNLGR